MDPVRVKISGNGQVSIPSVIRRRWGKTEVVVIDKGDRVIVRPALSIDEVVGKYRSSDGPSTDEMRAAERAADEARAARGT